MKFPTAAIRITHTGYSVATSNPAPIDIDHLHIRQLDETELPDVMAGRSLRDRRAIGRLVQLAGRGLGTAYLVTDQSGGPVFAAVRVAGGPKSADVRREFLGRAIPLIGERDHLLANPWAALDVEPSTLVAALAALAFVDPPANLARTVMMLRQNRRRTSAPRTRIASSLAAAGFSPYIHCASQFTWKRPWRRKIDWIGPPPPARSVISPAALGPESAGSLRMTNQTQAVPSQFTQEVTP